MRILVTGSRGKVGSATVTALHDREAVARGYRFYSYGDASLLLPHRQ